MNISGPPTTSGRLGVRIAIRVDATQQIGIGHVVRCLTLADALSARGASVAFLCRPLPGLWKETIQAHGHRLLHEGAPPAGDTEGDIAWSRSCLGNTSWDWVAVDHYGLDSRWERAVVPAQSRLLVIDDLADREHDCDLLLDQNYLPDREVHYRQRVPPRCQLLLGPTYALLRPEYVAHRPASRRTPGVVRRVLVFFGGTDQAHLTERVLEALAHRECADLEVDVVCGADPERKKGLDAAAARRGRTRVFGPREHLADLMAAADVAVGAGGSTTWERLCLGLPSVVVTVADNQRHVSRVLADERLIVLLGTERAVTADSIRDALARLTRPENWPDVECGMTVCDGRGAARVVDAMRNGAVGRNQ